jgi:hypothetical protein
MLNIIKLFIFLFSLNQIKILNWKFELQFLGSQLTYLGCYLAFVLIESWDRVNFLDYDFSNRSWSKYQNILK